MEAQLFRQEIKCKNMELMTKIAQDLVSTCNRTHYEHKYSCKRSVYHSLGSFYVYSVNY